MLADKLKQIEEALVNHLHSLKIPLTPKASVAK